MAKRRVGLVIAGGGITGVAFGRLLQLGGFDDFVILEKEGAAGGLCRSSLVKGHVLDLGGGHFLCSKFPEVYRFIFDHLPEDEFNTFDRVSRIAIDGETIDYPIEYNLWQLPLKKQIDYLISCVQAANRADQPEDFEQWVRWKLGNAIADGYMIPYNRKIWGVEPRELATDWLQKIPHHDARLIVESCLSRKSDKSVFPSHDKFMYPRRGGFQTMFDAIYEPVRHLVRLSAPLVSLRRSGATWIVNDEYQTEVVVNTLPWSVVHRLTVDPPAVEREVSRLQTSSLVISLHEEAYDHDCHWTYVADPNEAHHREFFIRNFAPHSAPGGIFRETNAKRFTRNGDALAVHFNQHAYPVPLRGHTEAARRVWQSYSDLGVIGVGRWGQHRYHNSDVCIREAMRMTQKILAHGLAEGARAIREEVA